MSFFCNSGCRGKQNNCSRPCSNQCVSGEESECTPEKSCECKCTCTCQADTPSTQVEAESTPGPQTVRALLNTVIDSCCVTDDVCRELTFCASDIPPCSVEVGTSFDVEINGDISFREVTRKKDNCVCVSTVRYNIPIRIFIDESGCGCGCTKCLDRNITVIRSARLCCNANSMLTTFNSQVIAASAVVSEICGDRITITLCLLFRSCLQQTVLREYTWEATPVCESPNCHDARNNLLDSCDTVCGCVSGFTCPSC